MSGGEQFYSPDYFTARERFRDAVTRNKGRLDSLELDAKGPGNETLTIDIGWFGPGDAKRVLVHSSGLHGVEGFAGSAIQLSWLDHGPPRHSPDGATMLVHTLNPYGFAWLRRVNENNVDLNRNFSDEFEDPAELRSAYAKLDWYLNPASAEERGLFYPSTAWIILRYGIDDVRRAVGAGQHFTPKGLFYGGARMEQGPALYQEYVKKNLSSAVHIVGVDVHTGLGDYAEDTLLVDASEQRMKVNMRMHKAYGDRMQLLDLEGIAYTVHGAHHNMYYRLFRQSDIYFAGQEFGTIKSIPVLAALRAENRWHQYGSGALDHPSKKRLLEAFCPSDSTWRARVVEHGHDVLLKAAALAFDQPLPQSATPLAA
jgi:hypothetical protein